MTWRAMIASGAVGNVVAMLFIFVAHLVIGDGYTIPIVLVIGAVFGVGAGWTMRARGGATFTFVITVLWLVLGFVLPKGYLAFAHPASWVDLVAMTIVLVSSSVSIVGWFRGRRALAERSPTGRNLLKAAAALVVLSLVVGVASAATTATVAPEPGDLRLEASRYAYYAVGEDDAVPTLTAAAGEVSVWVTNLDPSHHDFTIAGGVASLQIPGGKSRRVTVTLAPGAYAFVCTLHTGMGGTITVT